MVMDAAGRYRRWQGPGQEGRNNNRYWICLDCGCLIGPVPAHREIHDAWHAKKSHPTTA
jgi:hypothetical protein